MTLLKISNTCIKFIIITINKIKLLIFKNENNFGDILDEWKIKKNINYWIRKIILKKPNVNYM